MTNEHKKGRQRSKHVQYSGAMQELMKPWTVSLTTSTLEAVTIKDWILRVKRSVVVDGKDDMFTEEAFRKAMEEEERWMATLRAKEEARLKGQMAGEEQARVEAMKAETRRRKQMAEQHQSTEFTRLQLKQVLDSAIKKEALSTPTPDAEGNFYVSHGHGADKSPYDMLPSPSPVHKRPKDDQSATPNTVCALCSLKLRDLMLMQLKEMGGDEKAEESEYSASSEEEEEEKEPSPEPVIELTAEELEAEQKRRQEDLD